MDSLVVIGLVVLLQVPLALSVRVVQEGERIVVLRLGRFHSVLRPGLRVLLPGLDQAIRVSLNMVVPGWQGLQEDELDARLQQLATTGQLVPTPR